MESLQNYSRFIIVISCIFPRRKESFVTLVVWPLLIWLHWKPWWRHQMETFSALLAICAGNSPVSGEFPAQRPVTRSFDIFFDVRLIKRLSKHSRGWWFETLSHPLWRHRNDPWNNCCMLCLNRWTENISVGNMIYVNIVHCKKSQLVN